MVTLAERWASEAVRYVREAAALPQGAEPVMVAIVREPGGPPLGLLYVTDDGQRGYQPHPVGTADVADAQSYAWRVLRAGGGLERFTPLYEVVEADRHDSLSAAARHLLPFGR